MSSKLFSRSGVFTWSPRGVDAKGLIVADFAQFFDPNASSIEQKIDFLDKKRLFEAPNLTPNVSVATNYRFNELAWSPLCSDAHPQGVLAGGTEDGTVVFFDAAKIVKESRLEIISARKDHHGHVLTIDVSREGKWMASGGGSGQILLWDCENLKTPFSPGIPNFQDQVKLLRWNPKTHSVFASISSRRVSFWDMRRNGAPVLEFAELANCDWSSICWNPADASQLIIGSQSQQGSVVQKWDSRFTSTPLKEYRHHQVGVTSIDWNKADDRLLISSGCDGQIVIWNHENGEVLGGVGNLQNDWIKSVKWNEVDPAQFAIQYYQHPIQISSLTTLGTPQPGAEVLAARISDQFVPGWQRAPLIGSSISLGARLATYWKSYDPQTQQMVNNVEVETILPEESIGETELAQFLNIKSNKRSLGWYLHERAYINPTSSTNPEDVDLEKKVWLVLLGIREQAGRSKMLRNLGVIPDDENTKEKFAPEHPLSEANGTTATTTTSAATTTLPTTTTTDLSTRSESALSNKSENPERSVIEKCSDVQWNLLDSNGWDLLQKTLNKEHLAVIKALMAAHQHVAAMMYAAQHDNDYLTMILEDFNRVTSNSSPLSSLMIAISRGIHDRTGTPSSDDVAQKIDNILRIFPDGKWRELLGLIIANENNCDEILLAMKHLGNRWLERGYNLRACIAFIIAKDVDGLLRANTVFSPVDRLQQALVLHQTLDTDHFSAPLEQHVIQFANRLLTHGAGMTAWNLVRWVKHESPEMKELKWTCYQVAGGRECTGDQPPVNPYEVTVQPAQKQNFQQQNQYSNYQQQGMGRNGPPQRAGERQPLLPPTAPSFNPYTPAQSQAPPPPNFQPHQNPNLAPMPPSSTFYPTPSWDHKPAPSMPPNMPPPKPTPPVSAGWNDPPPMALKAPTPAPRQNVMEINWKPMVMAPAPGGMMPNMGPRSSFDQGYQQGLVGGMNGMTLQNMGSQASAASSAFPSPTAQQAQQAPPQAPVIQLGPEEEAIMESINGLASSIIETVRVQAKIEKAVELRARIQTELPPRLAAQRFTSATRQHLINATYFLKMGRTRECSAILNQMARHSGDFVEISSFLPALKSLIALAPH